MTRLIQAISLGAILSTGLTGCASTLLAPHELEAMNQRESAPTEAATQSERFAAGFMARYGLDPDERKEFIEEVAADEEFVSEGKVVFRDQLESLVAEQLFDEFSEDAVKLALKNNFSLNTGLGIGFIGSLVVSDLLFSQSGEELVGGINLPRQTPNETLNTEEQANDYLTNLIKSRMAGAAQQLGYQIHRTQDYKRPAKDGVPPIDSRVFWLTPTDAAIIGEQPGPHDLVVQVVNMHVVKNELDSISPLLVSSLGFVPAYSTPEKYIKAFAIYFLEEVRFASDDVYRNEYAAFSTAQKRALVKNFIDPHGYLYRGQFEVGYNSGDYFTFKGVNYAKDSPRAKHWMTQKLVESPDGIFAPQETD